MLRTRFEQRIKHVAVLMVMSITLTTQTVRAAPPTQTQWLRLWQQFGDRFVSADGRVIDRSSPQQITTSEGQSYGLMFALMANDPRTFNKLLSWTENNLAQGDLSAHLPAWLWGQQDNGAWGVIDSNPASDSDVWIAYALLQAGEQWCNRRYTSLGKLLAARILSEEVVQIPGLGKTLLPAPKGFATESGYRLNPSYLPPPVMQYMTRLDTAGDWAAVYNSSLTILKQAPVDGFAADWVMHNGKQFSPDPQTDGVGSYNAIRVYLWIGLTAPTDPERASLVRSYQPVADWVAQQGYMPETFRSNWPSIANATDEASKTLMRSGPVGFSASMIPFLNAAGHTPGAAKLTERMYQQWGGLMGDAQGGSEAGYYDHVLTLFATGFVAGQYSFSAQGELLLSSTPRRCNANGVSS